MLTYSRASWASTGTRSTRSSAGTVSPKKLIVPKSRFNLLGNRLVLIAPKDSKLDDVKIGPGFDIAKLAGDGRIDRQPARREPVLVELADGAEIGGAEEGADLVEIVRPVDRRMQAEAGEAQIGGLRRLQVLEAEQVRAVEDALRLALRDLVHLHPLLVEEAAVEELRAEMAPEPKRFRGAEDDAAVIGGGEYLPLPVAQIQSGVNQLIWPEANATAEAQK